jgi:hypothetical protein
MLVDIRFRLLMIGLAIAAQAAPSIAQDDDDDGSDAESESSAEMPWSVWDGVERFRGQASILATSFTDRSDGVSVERNRSSEYATVVFELERDPRPYSTGHTHWEPVRVEVSGGGTWSTLDRSPTSRLTTQTTAGFGQALTDRPDTALTLDHETGEFELLLPSSLEQVVQGRMRRIEWKLMEGTTNEILDEPVESFATINFYGKAPTTLGTLTDTEEVKYVADDGGDGHETVGHVVLVPEWNDYEVIVTLEGRGESSGPVQYEKWRPLGSIDQPGTAGNYLAVHAELQAVGGKNDVKLPDVADFRFELADTSQEPGVAMNWPKDARAAEPDFRLVPDLETPGSLDDEAQTLKVPDPKKNDAGHPYARARIDSLDFGGRTELHVIAELENGRRIVGFLRTQDRDYPAILIPKRLYGDWIADSWREEHGVLGMPESDDEEDQPMGDGDNGDGFTLYEEYRGFVVRRLPGRRAEGDPARKDLFVLNLVGADAKKGIRMFADTTGLRVIDKVDRQEMDEEWRTMNGNYLDAPHRTLQHGVVIKVLTPEQMGHHGAQAFGTQANYLFSQKPRTTKYVGMPSRNDPSADTNKPHNLPMDDFRIAYQRTAEHELLHTIGVAHHGWGDYVQSFRFIPKSFVNNATGHDEVWMESGNNYDLADVRDEVTGARWVDKVAARYNRRLERRMAQVVSAAGLPSGSRFADMPADIQWPLIAELPSLDLLIGVDGGEHSGNGLCPMRYKFAEAYKAKRGLTVADGAGGTTRASRRTFLRVPKGTEDVGTEICESPTGTGVNDANHAPQSRYGNARQNYGDCAAQICPNDAYPQHDWGLQR